MRSEDTARARRVSAKANRDLVRKEPGVYYVAGYRISYIRDPHWPWVVFAPGAGQIDAARTLSGAAKVALGHLAGREGNS